MAEPGRNPDASARKLKDLNPPPSLLLVPLLPLPFSPTQSLGPTSPNTILWKATQDGCHQKIGERYLVCVRICSFLPVTVTRSRREPSRSVISKTIKVRSAATLKTASGVELNPPTVSGDRRNRGDTL